MRTIELHKSKIKNYRNNHHDYKLILLVLDESSGYIQVSEEKAFKGIISSDKLIAGALHLHFWDVDFLKPLIGVYIDFLIWYTPFKMIRTENGPIDLPKVCVFDIKAMNIDTKKYNENRILSYEG